MARYVKISTVAPAYLSVDPGLSLQAIVDMELEYLQAKVAQVLPDQPDLIVLPEVCDQPANMVTDRVCDYLEVRGDQVRDMLAGIAAEYNCYLAYSSRRIEDDGCLRNSTFLLDRSGATIGRYNKNHVMVEEHTVLNTYYGGETPLIQCDFGTVGCAICFDLNFDELRLKYQALKPDLILFCSMYHGGLMQAYWAYSCRAHFVGSVADRPSAIITPVGTQIATTTNYTDYVTATVNLDCCVAHLDYNWERFRAAKEKYGPKVKILDPGFLGSVLVSSETDEFTIDDLVAEFGIEKLDDYLDRALAHRHEEGHIEPCLEG